MFTRGWLREVAYSPEDPEFAALADLLNQGNWGFHARFQTNCRAMEHARLRQFFPPPVTPAKAVRGYGERITFGQVIPPEKLGELYDDRGPGRHEGSEDLRGAYVLLNAAQPRAFEDRRLSLSPKSAAIEQFGFMSQPGKHRAAAAARPLFLGEVRSAVVVPLVEPRTYVPLMAIAELVIEKLKQAHQDLTFHREVYDDPARWEPLSAAISKVNGRHRSDEPGRALLAAWTSALPPAEVVTAVMKARCELAHESGVRLEGEAPPVFESDLAAALANLNHSEPHE
jgi:hypothetical protein